MEEDLPKVELIPDGPPTVAGMAFEVGRLRGEYEPLAKQIEGMGAELAELRADVARIDKQTFKVGLKAGMIASVVAATITIVTTAAAALLIRWLMTSAALPASPGS